MAKAKSAKQQMAAGAALSAKRGKRPKSSLKGASQGMVESMSEDELEMMASSKRKKLPRRAAQSATKRKTAKKKTAKRKTTKRKTAKKKTAKTRTAKKKTAKRKTAKKRAAKRR